MRSGITSADVSDCPVGIDKDVEQIIRANVISIGRQKRQGQLVKYYSQPVLFCASDSVFGGRSSVAFRELGYPSFRQSQHRRALRRCNRVGMQGG